MNARVIACVILGLGLAACPDGGPETLKGFKPPAVAAKAGYCPELIESCPAGSHPVTGVRASAECSDTTRLDEHGWKTEPRDTSKPLPLVVGKCEAQGDCLVYCRLDAPCEAQQIGSDAVVCTRSVCGENGCEMALGERRACGPNSAANCTACPGDCSDGCADGVDEPGESCEPCTPFQALCKGNVVHDCRPTGIGTEPNENCSTSNTSCSNGMCVDLCGNNRCDVNETAASCPGDCACTGTAARCFGTEAFQCSSDQWTLIESCGAAGKFCTQGMCHLYGVCGNTLCETATENSTNCPADCP